MYALSLFVRSIKQGTTIRGTTPTSSRRRTPIFSNMYSVFRLTIVIGEQPLDPILRRHARGPQRLPQSPRLFALCTDLISRIIHSSTALFPQDGRTSTSTSSAIVWRSVSWPMERSKRPSTPSKLYGLSGQSHTVGVQIQHHGLPGRREKLLPEDHRHDAHPGPHRQVHLGCTYSPPSLSF